MMNENENEIGGRNGAKPRLPRHPRDGLDPWYDDCPNKRRPDLADRLLAHLAREKWVRLAKGLIAKRNKARVPDDWDAAYTEDGVRASS